jgi:hypothetical protein
MKARSKALQERKLSPIPDRIAGWIGSDRKIEADHGAPRPDVADADPVELPTLEAPELGIGRARGRRGLTKAQPGGDPGVAVLVAEAPKSIAGSPPTAIGWAFSRSHWTKHPRMAFAGALPRILVSA